MTEADTQRPIAGVDNPAGILWDILLRPGRFFSEATGAHFVEGAKVGTTSAVLGAFLAVAVNLAFTVAIAPSGDLLIDPSAAYAAPVSVGVFIAALGFEFFVALAMAKMLGGRGRLKDDVLAFGCSLAPCALLLLPLVGWMIAPGYQAALLGFGLGRSESISSTRGMIAAFTPMAVAGLLLIVVMGLSTGAMY